MGEPVEKRLKVTFHDGLPMGSRGTFTYEGERYIAVPFDKYREILSVSDQLLAIVSLVRTRLTKWVGAHPDDAERVVFILQTLAAADTVEIIHDKAKAHTQ